MKKLDPTISARRQNFCGGLEQKWTWIERLVTQRGEFAMLVLSRKSGESVVVGGADGFHRVFKVTVAGIQGTKVKLGFEVDPDVPIHRSEAWERINGRGQAKSPTGEPAATTK